MFTTISRRDEAGAMSTSPSLVQLRKGKAEEGVEDFDRPLLAALLASTSCQ
jgi:hypothetical protein